MRLVVRQNVGGRIGGFHEEAVIAKKLAHSPVKREGGVPADNLETMQGAYFLAQLLDLVQ